MSGVLWVTGAGSGMGAAISVAAAEAGWRVALSGRRREPLEAVAARCGEGAAVIPLDVQDPGAAAPALDAVRERLGPVTGLALAAGLNVPRRSWAEQSLTDFQAVVATNLTGVAAVVDAALPDLRAAAGTAVIVSSFSAWAYSAVAGVAYGASKTALGTLCRSLNAEEERHGVRATHLCPGDVATDFLDARPEVPDAAARARMLQPDDVARAALFALSAPPHVRVDELVISPCRP
ncbi:SDR family oxidoreductase [Amnibacterium endophyticum]|uniref:SDR family oxidoreductase n=1 Tax=Amnibacterium endophyticum TaxID=2109337 RepID=A0ABW4LK79_9MICO